MIRSLWIAKTGMESQQTSIDVISNNLANVSTTGFKKSRPVFEDLIYQTLRQPGAASSQTATIPSGMQVGTGVQPVAVERIHLQGNLQQTGNPLDVAIQGNGFFAVQYGDTTAYTRDGSFTINKDGAIVDANGNLLSPSISIPANVNGITIGKDGAVSYNDLTTGLQVPAGNITLTSFANPTGLQSMGSNLYMPTNASGEANSGQTPGATGMGSLQQGSVETSNVNVVEEMVNMIQAQRAYELNSKAITASNEMLQRLVQM